MKKLLLSLLVFVSFVSYGQRKYYSVSVLSSVKGDFSLDMKTMKFGGIGIDTYSDEVKYDDEFFSVVKGQYDSKIFNNQRNSIGLYYISPSIRGFDLIVGMGEITYSVYDSWEVGDWVNGYYRSNGTYVNGYYRNVRNVSGYREVDKTKYLIGGLSKSVKIYNNIHLIVRGVFRYQPKYGNEDFGYKVLPQPYLGIKLNF